ncbi:MAG TPA: homoserine dehydrogenase, partial [Longimicrobium sp.]
MKTLVKPAPVAGARRRTRTVRVALAGCGVVGGELVRLLHGSAAEVGARHGVRFELVSVLVRDRNRPRPAELPDGVLTTDLATFLAARADVVVEAVGGTDVALRVAEAALGAGRRLVTANKAVVAAHGSRLAALARRSGGRLDFESAVGGGIPVVRALRDSLAFTGIERVRGILNGTTNFILTRLAEGWKYAAALDEARARGFAEADPTRDVSGADSADKIRILAWLAFGAPPASLPVRRRGIVPEPDRLARDASILGGTV